MRNHTIKGFALVAGACLVAIALSAPANARTLRRGSTGGGALVTGSLPGQVLWTYYETTEAFNACSTDPGPGPGEWDGCNHGGNGDNIIRLINPNGAANVGGIGGSSQPVCAMIYVFDDDEEMGECCGCKLTSAQLLTISVTHNLTANWGITGNEGADNLNGAIAIVAADPNGPLGTCDPGAAYSISTDANLLGSITHNQIVQVGSTDSDSSISGLTEIGLFDNGSGDPTNNTYLVAQCSAALGNASGGGQCDCPPE